MRTVQEQRMYERYTIPVILQIPDLSDLPLVPEDVSAGGFKVMVTKEPKTTGLVECSLQVSNEVFDECKARIAWVKKNEGTPDTWDVGLTIKTLVEDRDFLDITLHKVNKGLQ